MARIIALALGRVLNAVSAVIMLRLYTQLLTPEQAGRLSLFVSLTSLFALVLIAPVSSYVMRMAINWHAEGALREHLKRPLVYALIAASLAAIGSGLLVRMGLLHASAVAGPLVGLAVLGLAVSNVGVQLFNYLGQPYTFVTLSCMTSWGAVALSAVLCSRVSATAEAWVFGLAAAQLGSGCLTIFLIARLEERGGYKQKMNRGMPGFNIWTVAKYSAPLLLATGCSWVQTDGYRYFFVRITDEQTLGLFVAGFAVGASPMAFVDRLITDAYLPTFTRDLALKSKEHWPRSWEAFSSSAILPLMLFGTLACSGTSLFAKLLVAPSYSAFAWVGFWGGLVKSLQMIASLYVGFSYGALETKHLPIPYLIGAVVTLLCLPVCVLAIAPVAGVAASLACGSLAVVVSMARSTKRRYGLQFPYAACRRAAAFGVPIAATNMIANAAIHNLTAFAAVTVLGVDVIYIAAVCWLCYPKVAIPIEYRVSVLPEH